MDRYKIIFYQKNIKKQRNYFKMGHIFRYLLKKTPENERIKFIIKIILRRKINLNFFIYIIRFYKKNFKGIWENENLLPFVRNKMNFYHLLSKTNISTFLKLQLEFKSFFSFFGIIPFESRDLIKIITNYSEDFKILTMILKLIYYYLDMDSKIVQVWDFEIILAKFHILSYNCKILIYKIFLKIL